MLTTVLKKKKKLRLKMMLVKEEAENSYPVFHRDGRTIL